MVGTGLHNQLVLADAAQVMQRAGQKALADFVQHFEHFLALGFAVHAVDDDVDFVKLEVAAQHLDHGVGVCHAGLVVAHHNNASAGTGHKRQDRGLGARRHVHNQKVQFALQRAKLFDHAGGLGRVQGGHGLDGVGPGDQVDTVAALENNLAQRLLAAQKMPQMEGADRAQRLLGVVDTGVGIQNHHGIAHIVQRHRQVDRHRGLTYARLAAGNT